MEDVLSRAIAQVDNMLDRVEKVIGRERPEKVLRPDVSYPRRAKLALPAIASNRQQLPRSTKLHKDTGYSTAVASGTLAGNEMRLSGYTPRPRDDDPTGMWAAFETDFDDMVAGMH